MEKINITSKEKNLMNNTTLLYIMKIATLVFPLITMPYLTRVLKVEGYDVVTFVASYISYFQLFIDFGFTLSATKKIAQNKDDEVAKKKILSSVIASKIILGIVGFIVLVLLTLFIPKLASVKVYAYLAYVATFATIFLPDFLFMGIEQMGGVTLRYVITKSIFTALVFFVIRDAGDLYFVPLLTLLGEIVAAFFVWYYIVHKLHLRLVGVSFKDITSELKSSSSYFFSRIATTLSGNTNVFILGLLDFSTAIFGTARSLAYTIIGLYGPIADSLYPYMVNNKNFKVLKNVLLIFMPIILVGCVLIFFLSDWVVGLVFTEEYSYVATLLKWMIPLIIISFPSYIFGFPALGALGMTNKANSSAIIASLFHGACLGILLLLGKVNMFSVIILTTITELLTLSLRVYWYIKGRRKAKNMEATL